jgi:putative transposase
LLSGADTEDVPGFAVVPHWWVVERTFAWLGEYHRAAKDYKHEGAISENVIYLAVILILLHWMARAPF